MNRYLRCLTLGVALVLTACTTPPLTSPPASTTVTTAPVSSPTATPTAPTPSAPDTSATMRVTLYFSNTVLDPGASECSQVYAVHRTIPEASDVLTATLKELLAGPTAAEKAQGYGSWFSASTAQSLLKARTSANTSYVNLNDIRTVIPNASTSCGSAALLAQLKTTAQQAAMTPRVLYAIKGQPSTFWEWLQMDCDASNDNCDPTPFAS
ncbi:MAG: GerMN domain-containing protein [Micropruina sp.]